MSKKWLPLVLGLCICSVCTYAQPVMDTLRLPLDSAEKLFLDSNFQLLAQRYNVDASQALVIQARLWPNPNFQVSHGLYSGALRQWFPTGASDETTLGLSQLIMLAGKRNKQVKLAQAGAQMTEYQFFDLLRTLKYTLRTDFYHIYYLQQSSKVYFYPCLPVYPDLFREVLRNKGGPESKLGDVYIGAGHRHEVPGFDEA